MALGLVRKADIALGHIQNTDIMIGPDSKSLTEWGSSRLCRQEQVQTRKFMHHFMMIHQDGFAWNETQQGLFRKDFFPPVRMPITEHVPWVLRNMPIPPGIYNAVLEVVREKIAAGVYEQSN
jgi:hypothetical protein